MACGKLAASCLASVGKTFVSYLLRGLISVSGCWAAAAAGNMLLWDLQLEWKMTVGMRAVAGKVGDQ
jgi:hypothetical protein